MSRRADPLRPKERPGLTEEWDDVAVAEVTEVGERAFIDVRGLIRRLRDLNGMLLDEGDVDGEVPGEEDGEAEGDRVLEGDGAGMVTGFGGEAMREEVGEGAVTMVESAGGGEDSMPFAGLVGRGCGEPSAEPFAGEMRTLVAGVGADSRFDCLLSGTSSSSAWSSPSSPSPIENSAMIPTELRLRGSQSPSSSSSPSTGLGSITLGRPRASGSELDPRPGARL